MNVWLGRAGRVMVMLLVSFSVMGLQAETPVVPEAESVRGAVTFESPRNRATALGPTRIELGVNPPAGVTVESIELRVDGISVTTLTAAPWVYTWDAGDGADGHLIKAVARLSDGRTATAFLNTSPLRINQVQQVDLVNLYVVVRDKAGNYVTDLEPSDFVLTEDGRRERIDRFTSERKGLQVAVVLDTSTTMSEGRKIESARKAALSFLDVMENGDQGMFVTFSDRVEVRQEVTDQPALLEKAIRETEPEGGTALYDAIWRTSKSMSAFNGRKVMVLLSDGRDEARTGLEPGSLHTLEEALDQALRKDIMIFAIGFGRDLENKLDFYGRESLASILDRIAGTTGGRAFFSRRSGQLKQAFDDVAADLRHQYSVAYSSDNKDRDGAWREVRLSIPGRPDLEVVTRSGYYAPAERASAASAAGP